MELLVLIFIAIVLCLILNISLNYIVVGLVILIGVLSGLFAMAFLSCAICLVCSKKKEAIFLRTDKVKGIKLQCFIIFCRMMG